MRHDVIRWKTRLPIKQEIFKNAELAYSYVFRPLNSFDRSQFHILAQDLLP